MPKTKTGFKGENINWGRWTIICAHRTVPQFQKRLMIKCPTNLQALIKKSGFFSISGYLYVLTLFISCFLFKQTFAIPGSVFLNLLAGKIFGLERGLPMVCLLTAIGASFCYYLAKFAGRNAGMR